MYHARGTEVSHRLPYRRNPSYKHVRWYADKTAQANGIASFMDASKTIATYTYQRLDGSIDVEGKP